MSGATAGTPRGARVTSALASAAQWRLLGLLFERPREAWAAELRALASALEDDDALRAAAGAAADASEGPYLDTLGPGGRVSPREVAYCGMADPGHVFAGIGAHYDAFGYRPRVEDPIDHVAVEAGFVGFLLLKEAYALDRGDGRLLRAARRARRAFMADHVSPMAHAIAGRLGAEAPAHLQQAAAALAARCGPPAPRRPSPALPVIDTEDAIGCPGAVCG